MKRLIAPLVLFLAGLVVYSQSRAKWEAGPGIRIVTNNRNDSVIIEVLESFLTNEIKFGRAYFTNQLIDARIVVTLETNWVPVETRTGKREVGIVISNTYARVMWNWKTNDYIQESVVMGQALVREPLSDFRTNVFIIQPSHIPTNFIWR